MNLRWQSIKIAFARKLISSSFLLDACDLNLKFKSICWLIGVFACLQIRYTGFRDRPQEERKLRFANGCRESFIELSFVTSGTNVQLVFSNPMMYHHHHGHSNHFERELDFEKEHGKVSYSYLIFFNEMSVSRLQALKSSWKCPKMREQGFTLILSIFNSQFGLFSHFAIVTRRYSRDMRRLSNARCSFARNGNMCKT